MERQASEETLARLQRLLDRLEQEMGQKVPVADPSLATGTRLARAVKRAELRLLRPLTRRADRTAAELAGLGAELAERVVSTQAELARLQQGGRTDAQPSPPEAPDAPAPHLPDEYYWAFERRQRGSAEEIAWRLRQYEDAAVALREGASQEHPLWIDLGCGRGEFCQLLREWGWMAWGVDTSASAVDACREAGIEATVGEALSYLTGFRGPRPSGLSAIQLIEHLPKERWLTFFERARSLLGEGGGLLVETINPLNVEALSAHFFADVSHTWPAHPETLRLMAEHAGFARTEIRFVNPDHRGNPQDFALWAWTS